MEAVGVVYFWLALSFAAGLWARRRGRSGLGWFAGSLVFSPVVGFAYLAVLDDLAPPAGAPDPRTHVKCPDCAELVRAEARVCRYCGCRLVAQP